MTARDLISTPLGRAVEAEIQAALYPETIPIVAPEYVAPRWTPRAIQYFRRVVDEAREEERNCLWLDGPGPRIVRLNPKTTIYFEGG